MELTDRRQMLNNPQGGPTVNTINVNINKLDNGYLINGYSYEGEGSDHTEGRVNVFAATAEEVADIVEMFLNPIDPR